MRENNRKNVEINESMLGFWANFTFDKMLSLIDEYHIEAKEILTATNFWNEIKNKPVTGKSIAGIREINNKDGGIFKEVSMSEIFYKAINKDTVHFLPIFYLLESINEISKRERNISIKDISGILGRFYRSYASLLRDFDANNKMNIYIRKNNTNINFQLFHDPEFDIKLHTDIGLELSNNERKIRIAIWLYLNTSAGAIKTKVKITESMKGKLPFGIHLFAPINMKKNLRNEMIKDWILYSEYYIEEIVQKCIELFNGIVQPDLNLVELKKKIEDNNQYQIKPILVVIKILDISVIEVELKKLLQIKTRITIRDIAKILITSENDVRNILKRLKTNIHSHIMEERDEDTINIIDEEVFIHEFANLIRIFYNDYNYMTNDKKPMILYEKSQ